MPNDERNPVLLLTDILIMLGAILLVVPVSLRLGLGSLPGYLLAGVLIGPYGLNMVVAQDELLHFAELGVALLLFTIGLSLEPARLWAMRRSILIGGGMQVAMSALLLGVAALAIGLAPITAAVVGIALALSSVTGTLQSLRDNHQLATQLGRLSTAILLMQQLVAIGLLLFIGMMGTPQDPSTGVAVPGPGLPQLLVSVPIVAVVLFGGRYLLRPAMRRVTATHNDDLLTAATLFLLLGVGVVFTTFGLPVTLGAFLVGMLLADSGYRYEFETRIDPFRALLLGLFFVLIGATIDLNLLVARPLSLIGGVLGLIVLKTAVLQLIAHRLQDAAISAGGLARTLAAGSEIAIVTFSAAYASGLMDQSIANLLILTVTFSLMLTPLAFSIIDRLPGRQEADDSIETTRRGRRLRVFISYARRDAEVATNLVDALEADGFEVAIDTRDLPFGEAWQIELDYHIAQADAVVWLVSDASIASRWCQWELARVEEYRKRLVPVIVDGIDHERLPEAISQIQLLPRSGMFDPRRLSDLQVLRKTLLADHAWLKEHTRLAERARLWQGDGRSADRLLRGSELVDAEQWRVAVPDNTPPPAAAVLDLIHTSRLTVVSQGGPPDA